MRFLKLWLPVIVWAAVILWASTDDFSAGQSRGWLSWLLGRDVAHGVNVAIRKLGHIVAYGILGALSWRADRRVPTGIAIALIVAVIDEGRQGLATSRTGSPWDVLLDVTGSWLGMAGARRIGRIERG